MGLASFGAIETPRARFDASVNPRGDGNPAGAAPNCGDWVGGGDLALFADDRHPAGGGHAREAAWGADPSQGPRGL